MSSTSFESDPGLSDCSIEVIAPSLQPLGGDRTKFMFLFIWKYSQPKPPYLLLMKRALELPSEFSSPTRSQREAETGKGDRGGRQSWGWWEDFMAVLGETLQENRRDGKRIRNEERAFLGGEAGRKSVDYLRVSITNGIPS